MTTVIQQSDTNPSPEQPLETPEQVRRRRLVEAKRQFSAYLSLGAIDPAITLYRGMTDAGEGWTLEPTQLQPIVNYLRNEKRWDEATPFLVELVQQLQSKVNTARLTLAQIAVKKVDRPDLAIETLAGLDHRQMTVTQRDVALEMQGRARRMMVEDNISPELLPFVAVASVYPDAPKASS